MNPAVKTVTVERRLVRHVRVGAKDELSVSASDLLAHLDKDVVEPPTVEGILARFDESRALFETVGFAEDASAGDVVLDLDRWPRLVLRIIETRYAAERRRLDDAKADRIPIPERDIPALGELLAEVRRITGAPRKHRPRYESFLEEQRARRRNRRPRGDG